MNAKLITFMLSSKFRWVWRKWNGPKQLQDKKTGTLMMLPTDYVLVTDKNFKKYAKAYAEDQDLFFKEYVIAFNNLFGLHTDVSKLVSPRPLRLFLSSVFLRASS